MQKRSLRVTKTRKMYRFFYTCLFLLFYFLCHHLQHHHQVALAARNALTVPLTIRPNHLSLLSGLLDCIQCPHRTDVSLCWSANTGTSISCVNRRMSLLSLSLLSKECPACLVHLSWMVCQMGGKWPYNCGFVGCRFQDSFKAARLILV